MAEGKIMLYGHAACPMLPPVRAMLDRSGAAYEYVNIRRQPEAAALVRAINNGYESVPTLVFPDGSTLTEPSANALGRKLRQTGHTVPVSAWIMGNAWLLLVLAALAVAVLRALGVF